MGLEVGTYITDLNIANPLDADAESFGAAHLRLVKSVLQNTLLHGDRATDLSLLNNVAALCVLANPTNALAAAQALVAATDGAVLRRSGTALGFGAIDMTKAAAVSNPIQYGVLTATQSIAGVGFTDITSLTGFALATGGVYKVDVWLKIVNSGAAGTNFRAQFTNTPAEQYALMHKARLTFTDSHYGDTWDGANGMWAQGAAGADTYYMHVDGIVKANAVNGGTMKFQFAQNAAVGTTTLQIGGNARVERLA